jgi:hypothetical protein
MGDENNGKPVYDREASAAHMKAERLASAEDVEHAKTLDSSTQAHARDQVPDIKAVGNTDMFQLLCKASSRRERWMKSTKAMYIERVGCIVQVTTQQDDQVAEALTFVPGVKIVEDKNNGRKLEKITS